MSTRGHVAAARRLADVATAYASRRASLDDVHIAMLDLVGLAPVQGEPGYRKPRRTR